MIGVPLSQYQGFDAPVQWRTGNRTFDLQLDAFTIANSTTLTTFYGVTIPASMLRGRMVEISIDGTYLQNGGGGSGFTFQVRLGGMVIFEDPTVNYASSAVPHTIGWRARLFLENLVTNAPRLSGEHWIAGSPAVVGDGNLGDITTVLSWKFGGATALDMTIAQLLEFRLAHTAALPSISFSRLMARADVFGLNR